MQTLEYWVLLIVGLVLSFCGFAYHPSWFVCAVSCFVGASVCAHVDRTIKNMKNSWEKPDEKFLG